jgi:hypothetical protein
MSTHQDLPEYRSRMANRAFVWNRVWTIRVFSWLAVVMASCILCWSCVSPVRTNPGHIDESLDGGVVEQVAVVSLVLFVILEFTDVRWPRNSSLQPPIVSHPGVSDQFKVAGDAVCTRILVSKVPQAVVAIVSCIAFRETQHIHHLLMACGFLMLLIFFNPTVDSMMRRIDRRLST